MERYCVTGGAGFIGSNIVEELLRRGHRVKVIDNFLTGKRAHLEPFGDRIELIEGDIRDAAMCRKAVEGCDYVLHQAALRSVPKSVDNPLLTNDININGTLMLLAAARDAGVRRVVYASSSSVYGECDVFPEKEDFRPAPISPYAVSKLTGEYYAYTYTKTFGLECVSLRYFNVFGPRQNPESKYSTVIPAFISNMRNGLPPVIEGDGTQSRDFTFVGNVVKANLSAAHAPHAAGETINVACGTSHSILDLARELNALMNTSYTNKFAAGRRGDVKKTYADIGKMKRILGMEPEVGFTEGLMKTVEWFDAAPSKDTVLRES